MLAAGKYFRPEGALSVPWNLYGDFTDPFQREVPTVGAVSMVPFAFNPFVTFTTQEPGQLRFHEARQVLSNGLLDIGADHLKKTLRLLPDLVDQFHGF